MNRKILFVNPWVEDFSCFDLWMKPLALLRFSAFFRKLGFQTRLIDCLAMARREGGKKFSTGKFWAEEIQKPGPISHIPRKFKRYGIPQPGFETELRSFPQPDFAFVTCCMTYWYTGAFRAIRKIKEVYPKTAVLLGGVYPTLCTDHAVRHSGADHVVVPTETKSVLDQVLRITGTPDPGFTLENVVPDFSGYPDVGALATITSTGCPYRCSYCAAYVLKPDFNQRPVEDCIAELDQYRKRYRASDLAFYDDALLIRSEKHFEKILDWIVAERPGWRLHLPNAVHAKRITPNLARKMKAAGFETIRLGFESSDAQFQKTTGNKVDNDGIAEAVEHLLRVGFQGHQVGAYVMYGSPGLDPDSVFRSVEFVGSLGVHARLATFSPVPGTVDFERYTGEVPEILEEPLLHNDVICRFRNPKEYNSLLRQVNSVNNRIELCPV